MGGASLLETECESSKSQEYLRLGMHGATSTDLVDVSITSDESLLMQKIKVGTSMIVVVVLICFGTCWEIVTFCGQRASETSPTTVIM